MRFAVALLATVVAAWPDAFSPNCTTSTIVDAKGSEKPGHGDYDGHDFDKGHIIEYPAVDDDGGVDTTCYAGYDQKNDAVKALQIHLNDCYFETIGGEGHALDVDGWYGPKTEEAIVAVQVELGFEDDDVDGIWGPDTGERMEYHAISKEGSSCRRADV